MNAVVGSHIVPAQVSVCVCQSLLCVQIITVSYTHLPVLEDFARDMEAVCPNAWFLSYTNPMSMLTGYMLRYTGVKTLGLCHSVQTCSKTLMLSLIHI